MRYPVAPMSLSIKLISAAVLVTAAGLAAASFITSWALVATVLIAVISLGCFLRAPVAYELSVEGLIVFFRVGSKRFGPLVRASRVAKPMGGSLRLWGNGGLFAATGIFWNRSWGTFRVYVTTSDETNLVFVETQTGKVLVSPANRDEFMETVSSLVP